MEMARGTLPGTDFDSIFRAEKEKPVHWNATTENINLFSDTDLCCPGQPVLRIYKPFVVLIVPIKLLLYTTVRSYLYIDVF